MLSKYKPKSALRRVLNNNEHKISDYGDIVIKNGSVGNKILGTISYINKKTNFNISIISEKAFNKIK